MWGLGFGVWGLGFLGPGRPLGYFDDFPFLGLRGSYSGTSFQRAFKGHLHGDSDSTDS